MTDNIRACLGLECNHLHRRHANKMSSSYKLTKQEVKLLEGLRWLTAAGFPQYVQLYKDDRFPSLETVESDHDFLDKDCLKALTRRLSTLHKLADANVRLPKNKQVLHHAGTSYHASEVYALSNRWRFDQLSQQWLWSSSSSSPSSSASCHHTNQPLHVETNLTRYPSESTNESPSPALRNSRLHSADSPNGLREEDGEELSPGGEILGGDLTSEEVISVRLTSGYASESSPQSNTSRHSSSGVVRRESCPPGASAASPMTPHRLNSGGSLSSAGSDTLFEDIPSSPDVKFDNGNGKPSLLTSNRTICRNSSITKHSEKDIEQDESISWSERLRQREEQHSRQSGEVANLSVGGDDSQAVLKRHSFYDNLPANELNSMTPDVQKELDSILTELYYNIGNLSENSSNIPVHSTSRNGSFSEVCSRKKSATLPVERTTSSSESFTSASLPTTSAKTFSKYISNNKEGDLVDGLTHSRFSTSYERQLSRETGQRDQDHSSTSMVQLVNGNSSLASEDDYPASCSGDWNHCQSSDETSEHPHLNKLYAKQLTALRKLSVLKLTVLFDKYCPKYDLNVITSPPRHSSTQPRSLPDATSDRKIFGVSLQSLLDRDLSPIPHSIAQAVDYLRSVGLDTTGIFRKSGTQSRIQRLQNDMDEGQSIDFSTLDVYDVADALKRYFRELPECLLTDILSSLFLTIFISLPEELRTSAVRRAVILLPDSHRQSLQFLLEFLHVVSEQSAQNQMTASNLAVCFLPSFFRPPELVTAGLSGSSADNNKKSADNKSDALWDYKAALACVTCLISHANTIFNVPEDSWSVVRMSSYTWNQELQELLGHLRGGVRRSHVTSYIQFCLDMSLTERCDWLMLNTSNKDVTLCVKDVHDNECLRTWRCVTEVQAEPVKVLHRLRAERHLWCEGMVRWHVVQRSCDNCDVFYSVVNIPNKYETLPREFCEFRCWRTDLPRGACALVSASTDGQPLVHEACTARAYVHASHAYIEPLRAGSSRLVLVSRVDLRGHSVDWYTSVYGKMLVNDVIRLRESFQPR